MAHKLLDNLKWKIAGDRRDQRVVIREAGFADESAATAWARSVVGDAEESSSEMGTIKKLRHARPDLTLSTVTYIVRQMRFH